MNIKVLGPGCAKCKRLEQLTLQALEELGIEATVEKVDDIYKIMQWGVMQTPALVKDEKVVLKGSVPKLKELKKLLSGE